MVSILPVILLSHCLFMADLGSLSIGACKFAFHMLFTHLDKHMQSYRERQKEKEEVRKCIAQSINIPGNCHKLYKCCRKMCVQTYPFRAFYILYNKLVCR